MSRFLDQIRKAKEARLVAARRAKEAAGTVRKKELGEEKPLVPEVEPSPPSVQSSPPPMQRLFPGELEERKSPPRKPEKPGGEPPALFPGELQAPAPKTLKAEQPEEEEPEMEEPAVPEPETPEVFLVPEPEERVDETETEDAAVPAEPDASPPNRAEAPPLIPEASFAPLKDEAAPPEEKTASLGKAIASLGEEIASLLEEVVVRKEEIAPRKEEIGPRKEEPASLGEEIASLLEEVVVRKEETVPAEEAVVFPEEAIIPLKEEAPAPEEEAPAPEEEASLPMEDGFFPKNEDVAVWMTREAQGSKKAQESKEPLIPESEIPAPQAPAPEREAVLSPKAHSGIQTLRQVQPPSPRSPAPSCSEDFPRMESPPETETVCPTDPNAEDESSSSLRPSSSFPPFAVPSSSQPQRTQRTRKDATPPEGKRALFPRELEDQGVFGEDGGEIQKRESPFFVPAEKETNPRGASARRGAKRGKGEMPIPGPESDPVFVNRITRVAPRPDKRVLSFYDPKHHICEEYRLLGKNLLHSFGNGSEDPRRGKVIALTSSVRGEGKTLTCMNLAQTLAEDLADRVLLLDGDMRHPKVHHYIGLPNNAGLNDLLAAGDPESILEDCLVRTDTGLHLLTAKTSRGNPAPLLDSPNMTRVLDLLRDRYSLVIIDTPPVLLATDSLILGARSDGMLFLLKARKTKREQIQEARQRIARLEIRLLGYVINNVRTFLPKIWSRYYYGNY